MKHKMKQAKKAHKKEPLAPSSDFNFSTLHVQKQDKPAILYLRCSTKKQNDFNQNNYSLSTQEGICRDFCKEAGYSISQIVSEVTSARHIENQKRLIEIVDSAEPCTIVVADCSRFSRDFTNAINLLAKCDFRKINVVSARDSLDISCLQGRVKFIDNLLMSKFESDMISTRIQSSVNYRKRHGIYMYNCSFGYTNIKKKRFDGRYVVKKQKNPEEYSICLLIKKLYYGCSSIEEIKEIMRDLQPEKEDKENIGDSLKEVIYNETMKTMVELPILEVQEGNFTFDDIAHVLNLEKIYKRGKMWTKYSVKNALTVFPQMIPTEKYSAIL